MQVCFGQYLLICYLGITVPNLLQFTSPIFFLIVLALVAPSLVLMCNKIIYVSYPLIILTVWGYGLLFVTLISVCSLVGVSVLPLMARKIYQQLMTALIGLAVGSLAASSAFHLLPQVGTFTK